MSIRRITISVPEAVAGRIKRAARTQPVSAWVTEVIESHLDEAAMEREWQAFYRDVGLTREDEKKGDRVFNRLTRGPIKHERR
jgi:hypothetical protein